MEEKNKRKQEKEEKKGKKYKDELGYEKERSERAAMAEDIMKGGKRWRYSRETKAKRNKKGGRDNERYGMKKVDLRG